MRTKITAVIICLALSMLAMGPALPREGDTVKKVATNWVHPGEVLTYQIYPGGKVYDATQSFDFAYFTSAGLLIAAAVLTAFVHPPQRHLSE